MKFTDKQTIENSLRQWRWCAETGEEKWEWPEWEKYGEIESGCFFCEQVDECEDCIYYKEFGFCLKDDSPLDKWFRARKENTKKKYAALIVEQIKEL
ncbi:hypothetical protein LCGC14_2679460 [marine sediment metagenome]|uniref:Uncharacterized protein n=1 Tax=marine sediment metagenome TaxID=412755 RepID=A0A0F9CDH3_9ZZZZ